MQSCSHPPSNMLKRPIQSPQDESERRGLRRKLRPRNAAKSSKSFKFLDLPPELRCLVYTMLIAPTLPTIPSGLTAVNRQVRKEVEDWLAGQELTICPNRSRFPGSREVVLIRDEPVLRRATNIRFDLACMPVDLSHHDIDLLCRLWRDQCCIKQVSFTVFNDTIFAKVNGRPRFIEDLPSTSKKLLCEWLMYPVVMVLDRHGVQPTRTSLKMLQPSWPVIDRDSLASQYQNDRAVAALSEGSAKTSMSHSDKAWAPLVSAVRLGHVAIVDVLFDPMTVDLKEATTSGRTLLMEATCRGHVQIVDRLLRDLDLGEMEVLLNLQDSQGETAYFKAVSEHRLEMVSYLATKPADPNIRDHRGRTPLVQAICQSLPMVKLVCQNNTVDKTTRDDTGCTVLHLTTQGSAVFQFLLQHSGVGINAVDHNGETPLFYAARKSGAEAVGRLIKSHGASTNVKDKDGRTPFSHAVEADNYEAFDLLLDGAGIDDVDHNGRTPLFYASDVEMVGRLIRSYGASSDVKDKDGRTPLSHAVEADNYKAIDLLLKAGADCTSEDKFGKSPISRAVESGLVAVTKLFVKHSKNGNGALKLAGDMGKQSTEKALLEMRRDYTNFKEGDLSRLLFQAAQDGRCDILERILRFPETEADIQDIDGRTLLSHAAETGHRNVIKLLLERKADQDLKDKRGQSPMDYAKKRSSETHEPLLKDWTFTSRAKGSERRSSRLRTTC
jgi:ankyrin repeat protein